MIRTWEYVQSTSHWSWWLNYSLTAKLPFVMSINNLNALHVHKRMRWTSSAVTLATIWGVKNRISIRTFSIWLLLATHYISHLSIIGSQLNNILIVHSGVLMALMMTDGPEHRHSQDGDDGCLMLLSSVASSVICFWSNFSSQRKPTSSFIQSLALFRKYF